MPALRTALALLVALSLRSADPAARPDPPNLTAEAPQETPTPEAGKPPRPEDKTLVAALDVEQGEGKDRLSVYRDGTMALVRTYGGVRTLKKKVLSEEEVALVEKLCLEATAVDLHEFRVDLLGRAEPRRFRVEVGRPDAEAEVYLFDELARVPLVLGRARGILEGLLARFDETTISEEDLWDPSSLEEGDVLLHRTEGKSYRIVRDDAFVRSLEMVEEERGLQRLLVLREDVPKLFLDPAVGKEPRR